MKIENFTTTKKRPAEVRTSILAKNKGFSINLSDFGIIRGKNNVKIDIQSKLP